MLSTREFRFKVTNGLKVKMEKKYYVNSSHKKAGLAILISDNVDFKTKKCYQRWRGTFNNDKRVNKSIGKIQL